LTNIKFSGLKGKALEIDSSDIPKLNEIKDVLPRHCFSVKTKTSLRYLFQSIFIQSLVVVIGLSIPFSFTMLPLWILYSLLSGTTAMGFWVLAHECGHGAFSKNRALETFIGYFLHSILLVPYFSWQRSHSIHHRFTNHISKGETHVPLVIDGDGINEKKGGRKELHLSSDLGKFKYGMMQLVLHLVFGWPAYLLSGSTGGLEYGVTNHFWPSKPFSNKLWLSNWINKVWISDLGVFFTFLVIIKCIYEFGFFPVFSLYIGPLLVVNCWLVIYTWLHHTDTDVPHLSNTEFSFIRGAFLTIDRPYGKFIDFLHHNIGSSHVIHHIYPNIPHYHAKEATFAIKEAFPKIYLYNPDPIFKALWNISCNCIAVDSKNKIGKYIWRTSYETKIRKRNSYK
tara:strand:+ start:678 stop:1865 length:1188 start_codon:yes stop_codon:yes gene_type:complete